MSTHLTLTSNCLGTDWCAGNPLASGFHTHKTAVGITHNAASTARKQMEQALAAGAQPAAPTGAVSKVDVTSLEATFVGAKNLPQTRTVEATVQATHDVAIKYDIFGNVQDSYRTKTYDSVISLGLMSVTQVAHVEIEAKGCGPILGLSFTVNARSGLDADDRSLDRVPVSFNYGRGAKPNPRWANGGTIDEADLFQLKFETDPMNENSKYYLYLHLNGAIITYNGCEERASGNDYNVVATVTSGTGTPLEDFDNTRRAPPAFKLGVIPHTSFEMVDRALKRAYPDPIEAEYLANGGGNADNNNSPDPIYVGAYMFAQVLTMRVELAGCLLFAGMDFHIRPSQTGVYGGVPGGGSVNHVQAYTFGHARFASGVFLTDRIKIRYVRENGWFHIWVTVAGVESECNYGDGPDGEQKPHKVTILPTVTSSELLVSNVPAIPDGMPEDAEVADVVSMQDASDTVLKMDNVLAAANLAVNRNIFEVKWNGTMQMIDEPDANARFTQYIGTYGSDDVVHVDIQDVGCNTNVGIYANIVARWGLRQDGYCAVENANCAPESFILGSAHPDETRDSIQLYWRPINDRDGFLKQDVFDLYVGVVEKQCGVPAAERTDLATATAWWQSSYLRGLPPKHTMTISVRSLKGPPRGIRCAQGEAVRITAEDKYVCSKPDALILKTDGSPQSPYGFQKMARISAEDIAKHAPSEPKVYGNIKDWDAATKSPVFGASATANTVLPYEMTVRETIYPHAFQRQFHYQFIEKTAGVFDPDNLMYGNSRYSSLDAKTGYLYLGTYDIEQVVQIDISDVMPSSFGQSITCMGKPMWGTKKAMGTYRRPKCFMYGSAVRNQGGQNIVYNMVESDTAKREVDYWIASAFGVPVPTGKTWRRDMYVTTKALFTEDAVASTKTLYWPKWSKEEQAANLVALNEAVDWENNMGQDLGVLDILSMEEVDAKL